MSLRTLIILAAVLLALAGIAYLQSSRNEPGAAPGGLAPGEKVFPGLDVNQAARVEIATSASTVTVARKDGRWVVATLHDYPASFQQVAESLRGLADMAVGQVVRDGQNYPEEFGLGLTNTVARVRVLDGAGAELAALALGSVQAPPGGMGVGAPGMSRYLRAGDGPVVLVEGATDLGGGNDRWISRDLVQVNPADVAEVSVRTASDSYTLGVQDGAYEMKGLKKNQEVADDAASRLAAALQYFSFVTVADPGLADEAAGLDQPSVLEMKTKSGFTYTVKLGGKTPDGSTRYARIGAAWEKPADFSGDMAEPEKALAELRRKLDPWTFLVSVYTADSMTPSRESLVREKAEPAEPAQGDSR